MKRLVILAVLLSLGAGIAAAEQSSFDVIIRGGRIVDGTGAPWYEADVAICGGKIAAIGRMSDASAELEVDAEGLVVAPGFIDMMGQTATPMLYDPSTALNLLTQGVTTINAGEGSSEAPLGDKAANERGWRTMAEYFQVLDLKGMPVNVVQTVGHTQVREVVMGDEDRRPRDEEFEQMQKLVREAMEAGAIGVSTALIYPPAVYARTEEIAGLAKVAGEYGGRYYTHMRNEGDHLLQAVEEALDIGREAGAPVHIYHLKAAGRHNWGKMQLAIARIHAARAEGQQVAADVYPYEFNGLGLEALIHPRHFARGEAAFFGKIKDPELRAESRKEMETTDGWENWFRHVGKDWNNIIIGNSSSRRYRPLHGKSIAEMAKEKGEDPWETFFNLVPENAFALPRSMSDANVALAMKQPFISFCTDVGPASDSRSVSHPRSHGAFPRIFARYVRELGVISLEEAVAKASAVAANEVMAYDRGRIGVGLAADLVIFDPQTIQDRATPASPREKSGGVKHVLVNGVPVLVDGKPTGQRPGRVLRGPGYDRDRAPHAVMRGVAGKGLEKIDRLMRDYLRKHRAPGASLAITDHGRLVYARGFGYADVAAREPVTPESLFRIASVSKPITAVAVMQLVEQGKLDLEARVYDVLDKYEPHLENGAKLDDRQRKITIRHLLQHRGGWDRDKSFDAMFQQVRFARALGTAPPAGHVEIIRCMLGIPLDFDPGERYAYSNYGYCLLGRIIEKLSGQRYDDYVTQHILKPLGIKRMAIGATHLRNRLDREVRYYDAAAGVSVFADSLDQPTPPPYGAWCLEVMDSHGAWLASAPDLVRFASALDEPAKSPLLNEKSINLLFARPEGRAGHDKSGKPERVYYGLGWQCQCGDDDRVHYQMHGGSLPGTSTKLVRRCDGRNFAVLFNARETAHTLRLAEDISTQINQTLDDIKDIPESDFFQEAGIMGN